MNPGMGKRLVNRAFSLIELLVVVTIVIILLTLLSPAVSSIMASWRISQATAQLVSAFSLASQRASAENRTMTLRLIASSSGSWQHLQLVERADDGTIQPLDRLVSLPETMQIATNPLLSSFFRLNAMNSGSDDPAIPSLGGSYRFIEFQIRPDGRLALDVDKKWFLTLIAQREDASASTPPSNFATVQIDPVNGGLNVYRP